MNFHTSKIFIGYSAFAAATIAGGELNAQIINHDIDPDFHLYPNDVYSIDFNMDGIVDASINNYYYFDIGCPWSGSSGPGCYGSTTQYVVVNGEGILSNSIDPFQWGADTLNTGAPITIEGPWTEFGWSRLYSGDGEWISWGADFGYVDFYKAGKWQNVAHKYIGMRFLIDGNEHYGWIEISLTGDPDEISQTLMIEGYAYEATAAFPIHAGDIGGCYPPVPTGTTSITSTSGKAKWEAVGSAEHYKLQYRATGALGWTSKIVDAPKTFRKITGLSCNTNYEWQVKTLCADGTETDYSPLQTFTTTVCKMGNENIIDEENISIWSYANQIHILIDEDILEPAQLILFDELGRNVFSNQITDSDNTFELNLQNGIYIATIYSGEKMYSKKIVIQN